MTVPDTLFRQPPRVSDVEAAVARVRRQLPTFQRRARRQVRRWLLGYLAALAPSLAIWVGMTWFLYPPAARDWMTTLMIRRWWWTLLVTLVQARWGRSAYPWLLVSVGLLWGVWLLWSRHLWRGSARLGMLRQPLE